MPQNTKTYSFKSSGLTLEEEQQLQPNTPNELPLGLKTPLSFGIFDEGLFNMHKDVGDLLADNFRNMLLTNHGERLIHYDFGANLRELTFELGTEDIDSAAMARIQATTSRYMPFIKLVEFASFTDHLDNSDVAKIGLSVGYNIPALNVFNRRVDITLYVGG